VRWAGSRAVKGFVAATLSASLLTGCAAVGPNFKPPTPPTVDRFTQAGDMVNPGPVEARIGEQVISEWWMLFHSKELDQVVREAIANNRSLEAARARLDAARAAVGANTGQVFLNGSAGYQRERANLSAAGIKPQAGSPFGGFPTNPEFNLVSLGLGFNYNLDLFGGVRRTREALEADAEAQARALDAAYLNLTGQVVAQALIIADADYHIDILNSIVANDQANLDIMKRGRAAGGQTDLDVATIAAQLSEDQSLIPGWQQRKAVARHQLALLVGKTPGEWSPPEFAPTSFSLAHELPVALPSDILRDRPDILEAEAKLHAATARIGIATAALYPNVTITAALNQQAVTPGTLFQPVSNSYSVGPNLTMPLFDSGQLHSAKREAEANARAALADYQQTVLTAFVQVADQLQAVAHDNEAYAARTKALADADEKLEITRRGLRAGGVTVLQLIDAERTWRQGRLRLADEIASRAGDAALLLMATATVPPGAAESGVVPPAPVAAANR
jgi:NodT family efflux transporter outer membrane factor (OMF) lipoprotein